MNEPTQSAEYVREFCESCHGNFTRSRWQDKRCPICGYDGSLIFELHTDGSECGPVGRQSPADPHPTDSP